MLLWFGRVHGLRYASLRYFNAAGSDGYSGECHQPESHLVSLVLQAATGERESISHGAPGLSGGGQGSVDRALGSCLST
jgi:UDP-glucose 4-epimerase